VDPGRGSRALLEREAAKRLDVLGRLGLVLDRLLGAGEGAVEELGEDSAL